ncbi:MAG TPA: hypothetical protein ENO38_05175 [Nitrososphaeria archaeon]|nr:hypothetical protein [Nitrososphaeria archaeon]
MSSDQEGAGPEQRSGDLRDKALRALRMLLISRGRPGIKGWELRRHFGPGYLRVLEVVKVEASKLGLELRSVEDEEGKGPDFARYMLVTSEAAAEVGSPLTMVEAAALALIVTFVYGGRNEVPLKEVRQALYAKLNKWRADQALYRLSRLGYIEVDDDVVRLGWRTRAEVNVERLARVLVAIRSGEDGRSSP